MQSCKRNQTLCQPGRDAVSAESAFCSYQISIGKGNKDIPISFVLPLPNLFFMG